MNLEDLYFFCCSFFFLGMIMESVTSKTHGLASWLIMLIFIEIYFLLWIWLKYLLIKGSKEKKNE